MHRRIVLSLALATLAAAPARADLKFERIVIDPDFPEGYQVEVADVDGDGKPDLVGVGGGTCAWYQNPTWTKRIISTPRDTPDIISSATADLDGDGRAEIAIAYDFAMNEPKRGKLLLAIARAGLDDPWTFRPIENAHARVAAPGANPDDVMAARSRPADRFPSIHRIRWGNVAFIKVEPDRVRNEIKFGLIAAPIFGVSARPPSYDQDRACLFYFDMGSDPKSGQWASSELGGLPIAHAIDVVDLGDPDGAPAILAANNLGVGAFRVRPHVGTENTYRYDDFVPGAAGPAPKKGASEIHVGRIKTGGRFLATVEPWHGTDVVVYASDLLGPIATGAKHAIGPRTVIDNTLDDGHALWVADVDGDGTDEVFAGHRGKDARVSVYRLEGEKWARTVIDRGITAQDLRGGDLDGDGVPDVVAIGGKSHNLVWYRPIRGGAKPGPR